MLDASELQMHASSTSMAHSGGSLTQRSSSTDVARGESFAANVNAGRGNGNDGHSI